MSAETGLVLGAITLDLFAVLLGGATAMLPLYARDILHVGADGRATSRRAGRRRDLTAIFFSVRPLKTDVGVKMLTAVVVFGAATAVFGISDPISCRWRCWRCSAPPTCSRSISASR